MMMNKLSMNFVKGMGAGLVVGATVGMLVCGKPKTCRNPVGRAVKTVGEVMENIGGAMGF